MRILVSGGAGYLGSLLVPKLLALGHRVRVLDTLTYGPTSILHFADHPNLELTIGDVRDRLAVQRAVAGQDGVVHLAAMVGFPACNADPEGALTTNVDGTRHIVESLDAGQWLVFASTGSTYGRVSGVCTEETPINPLTLYGRTKAEAEAIVMQRSSSVALRFATVFGLSPRLRLDLLINDFVYRAIHEGIIELFEGGHRRTFIHSQDATDALAYAVEHIDRMSGQVYNAGDEKLNHTKRDVAERIRDRVDFELRETDVGSDPDARDYAVDYSKIRRAGFACTRDLEAGLDQLVPILRWVRAPELSRSF